MMYEPRHENAEFDFLVDLLTDWFCIVSDIVLPLYAREPLDTRQGVSYYAPVPF
jgi:hypothetical protein